MERDTTRHQHELPIPDTALEDDNARELIRIWGARGAQHVTIATGLWTDPFAWGVVLVDLARHLARAYEQSNGIPQGRSLQRIREGFEAEWSHPTDEPTGQLREGPGGKKPRA